MSVSDLCCRIKQEMKERQQMVFVFFFLLFHYPWRVFNQLELTGDHNIPDSCHDHHFSDQIRIYERQIKLLNLDGLERISSKTMS